MNRSPTLVPSLLIALLPRLPLAAQEDAPKDRIWKAAGGVITGIVDSENIKEVAYRIQRNLEPQKIATAEVRAIEYGDKPGELEEALSKLAQREYENAVNGLKLLLAKKGGRDWIQQYGRFHLAEALREWGRVQKARLDEATAAYQDLLQAYPQTRFKPQAIEGITRCLLERGDVKGAEKQGGEFEKMAYGDWNSDEWVVRAKLLNGEILEAAGQFGEAVSKFETLEKFARGKKMAEAANEALARVGHCYLKKGDKKGAESHFRRIVTALRPDSPRSLGASAWTGLGQALLAQKASRDARLAFVQALVLYFGDEERSAEAALGAGQATEALAAEGEKDARSRAQVYYRLVVDRFPSTRAAAGARALLERK